MMTATSNQQPATSNQQPATSHSSASQAFLDELDKRLWQSARNLRSKLEPSSYKYIVLGIIFLKYISDRFSAQQTALIAQFQDSSHELYYPKDDLSDSEYQAILKDELEERDFYTKDNVFWVPEKARWENIKSVAQYQIGQELPWGGRFGGVTRLIDDAFDAIEKDNPALGDTIQRISGYQISDDSLIALINIFSDTNFSRPLYQGKPVPLPAQDILGHVYEYFLGQFAQSEGKKGGEFFTPRSIVGLVVQMLEPYAGRVYDPAMGSGGFFVQADTFIREHQGRRGAISIYGQEQISTTYRLAKMNMAIRGLSFNFGQESGDSFTNDQHPDLKADFVMANPPFNVSDWWSESLTADPRWQFGTPPKGNANFAWLSHMIYHLSPKGRMACVLANGSMSTGTKEESEIRKRMVQADLVECMVALPSNLFTNVSIPACIWFINKAKTPATKGKVLFIDTRQMGFMQNRTIRLFSDDDIARIADTYHAWQQGAGYDDQAGFCYSASLDDIAQNDFVLTVGRYVGTPEQEEEGIPFDEQMQLLTEQLKEQFAQSAKLEQQIKANLGGLGYGI